MSRQEQTTEVGAIDAQIREIRGLIGERIKEQKGAGGLSLERIEEHQPAGAPAPGPGAKVSPDVADAARRILGEVKALKITDPEKRRAEILRRFQAEGIDPNTPVINQTPAP